MVNKKVVDGFYHAHETNKVLKELSTTEKGLTNGQIKERLEKYGYNEIKDKKSKNPILIFLKQLNSFFVYILIAAAVISFILQNLIDGYVIAAVILINAFIGFFQEDKAEKSIKALKQMIVLQAKVFRNGELVQIPAKELVPGDIISIEEGDRIPADARLLEVKNFSTVESSLTGESIPVEKNIKILPEKTLVADCKNMIWMGTFVASGTAKAIVIGTGMNTEIGKIAEEIKKIKSVKTHFEQKITQLAKKIGIVAIIGALLIFLVGFFIRGFKFLEIFLFTIASLVAIIPEGLLAIVTIVLAIGAFRMAKRKAIIRNLAATETLGVVNTIITDKTGTLTQNTMNVRKIILPYEEVINVSGKGWEPIGDFSQKNSIISPMKNLALDKLLHISAICNNSKLIKKKTYEILGDPTEGALVVLAQKAGLKKEMFKRLDDFPFNQELKYRASLSVLVQDKKKEIFVVGAPEAVLKQSSFFVQGKLRKKIFANDKKQFLSEIDSLTKKGMRVLGFAYKEGNELSEKEINNLTFVGVVGIEDPPRPEVKEAIAKAKQAGIRIIMATGDHKGTALAIAKEIGLDGDKVLTEQELSKLSNKQFDKVINEVCVFARLTPKTKLKIAEHLQKQGKIVAMTGDGVNDAPALKKADIGIAMGIIGTDVARESSSIVLADDNFASIVNAIEEGRTVFINTKQATAFLVTTNLAEEATILATLFLGFPLPLLPTQILWLNLVTDTAPALALATEKSHHDVLEEGPRKPKENLLSKDTIPFLVINIIVMAVLALIAFKFFLPTGVETARTAAFVAMSFTQLFNVFNMRSLTKSVFKINFFGNKYVLYAFLVSVGFVLLAIYVPFFQGILGFAHLGIVEMLILFGCSSLVLWVVEGYKLIKKK
ncbi:MAG: HAD-IC family P-type ATPase [archaeon]